MHDAKYRAEIISDAVRFTAEVTGDSPELHRIVQALSAEREVSLIYIASLETGLVISANQTAYIGKSVSETTGEDQTLFDGLSEENQIDVFGFKPDNKTFFFASSFLIQGPSKKGVFKRAVVVVHLDTTMVLNSNRQRLRIAALVILVGAMVIVLTVYFLLSRLVYKPLDSLRNSIDYSSKNKDLLPAKVFRQDELGLLASMLNGYVRAEETARTALESREQELQLIFDSVPVRIWYKDDKNTILRLNKSAAESMGLTVEQVEGRNTADLFPEMAEKYLQDDLDVINSGQPKLNIMEKYTPLDAGVGWVKTDKIPYFLGVSSQRGVLVVAEDISELKCTEQMLRASEERFNLVSQATQDGIWDWPDITKDFVYWSPQYKALMGFANEEIEGSAANFISMLHPDDLSLVEKALDVGDKFDLDYRLKVNSGNYRWFRAKGLIVIDEETQVVRVTGSISDIQDQKDAEAMVQRYTEELERSNQELDAFAYAASHDLKAPLRGVAQLAEWVVEDLADGNTEEMQEKLRLMRLRIDRMSGLLTDLLLYARAGKQKQSMSAVSVEVLAQGAFELASASDGFKLVLQDDLPIFKTYMTPLDQVFRNLVGNAVKHHGENSGQINIGHEHSAKSGFYQFSVLDDGQGIDAKYHDIVFDMFRSLKSRDEMEGSGMGLAIVKKIVETYGGELWFESAPGEGSCFYFSWPIFIEQQTCAVKT